MAGPHPAPELARPYSTRQAPLGRRVICSWRPAAASPVHPLTTPWPSVDELIEGVACADEDAARRFDLDRAAGSSRRTVGGDVGDAGLWFASLSWDEAEAWLRVQEP